MLTLTYGFQKPVNGDRGPVVFPALEANWQQVNDHDHNGINSAPIQTAYLEKTKKVIAAADWTEVEAGSGHYTQVVVLPVNLEFDNVTLYFLDQDGNNIYPGIVKESTTQFRIFVSDPDLTITALVN